MKWKGEGTEREVRGMGSMGEMGCVRSDSFEGGGCVVDVLVSM